MRMKIAAPFLIAAGVLTPFVGLSQSPVHDLCHMSWGSDPEARRICIEEQIEGAQIVARYLDWAKRSAGADGEHVVGAYETCQAMWLPDYATMALCLQNKAAIAPPDWPQAD